MIRPALVGMDTGLRIRYYVSTCGRTRTYGTF